MSLSFQELPQSSETGRLTARLHRLKASLDWASEAIAPDVRDAVLAAIARCESRLALGVDFTIVALAGGTGSGKSSLFNALTETSLAEVSAARPTTAHVSAVAWTDADALLDWIGVDTSRRHRLVDPALDGVVLLDLPDHDSINESNRATVDAVLPLTDLIVWVVDPQKYADYALHEAYVAVASGHGRPSTVVLNHVDRLSDHDADLVARDLEALLSSHGLPEVPVMKVSARTGAGVAALRREIAAAGQSRSVAAEAVRADLIAAGRALEGALSRQAEPTLPDVDGLIAACARAAGVDARADAASAVVASGVSHVMPEVHVSLAAISQVRLEWIDAATAGLPVAWRLVLDDAVVGPEVLAEDINAALAVVEWPQTSKPTGFGAAFSAALRARKAAQMIRDKGRKAVRDVVVASVVEPTEMIHQAYRNLDELTVLD